MNNLNKEINPFQTTLTTDCFAWKLPKSNVFIPVITVCGSEAASADLLLVNFQIELKNEGFYRDIVVVDFEKLTLTSIQKKELLQYVLRLFKSVVYVDEVICPDNETNSSVIYYPNLKEALYKAAELMKKHRSDGGKQWVVDPKSLNYSISKIPDNEFHISVSFQKKDEGNILLCKVAGDYPVGSEGDSDARMLDLKLEYSFEILQPEALVVDMSKLNYTWGDRWTYAPFKVKTNKLFPFRLVILQDQEQYMKPLMGNEERISRSIEEALADLDPKNN